MASVDIQVGGYRYALACRDGEEEHLRAIAQLIDAKATEAARAMGTMGEARQLLFAALLLADELTEARQAPPPAPVAAPQPPEPAADPALAAALERLADRLEALAGSGGEKIRGGLEAQPASA